ncbi:hypothetical protein N431DRAFT_354371 [Stipitochalara longipes BDJ]|nr:hypothetical protein N431DRAFT_354371 [Stipitochalara longipes BDJ]
MGTILHFIIPLFFVSLVSALPNVTALQIGGGNCSAYPSSFHSTVDNADAFVFTPDQADNSSINGLSTGVAGTKLVVYTTKPVSIVASAIFCCDHNGTVKDGFGVQTLLLSNDTNDAELGYFDQGNAIKPETYAHFVEGVRQEGVFLGWGNVTTWGYRRVKSETGGDYYGIRLLKLGIGDLKNGEIRGFLKVVLP